MKLLTFRKDGAESIGALSENGKYVYPLTAFGITDQSMNELIDNWTLEKKERIENRMSDGGVRPEYRVTELEILAPIPVPKQDMICLGINYMEHAAESARYKKEAFGGERPYAVYFSKRINEAVPDKGVIESHSDLTDSLDYEAELAFIVGKDAKDVAEEDVEEYIFGYTIINDVSAREVQTRHKQWYFGKSLDRFTPMGPWIVTADEISFPPRLAVRSRVNGELRQDGNTKQLIFGIPHIMQELTRGMTLKAGTIVATGTPAGAGMGFDPPKFLKPGDVVECEIESIGRLTNTVG
ncbi:fumarylacetoacetate hydrolase family protein [Lachnotalea sp. AF33-28]|mgnify:CR=1 FL=1|uniref:fumarylacetoacetate hydrolase family protein n=1 Tax=Lachnotalea sp. AF33-28 TaxID=2292046 RepID=UPI000E4E0A0E|nr:fumarylacetoacetate hydrolase family protein [Lachnotalea sp. AF33-28]RHP32403.1 FAA hydrolase family protein [Lachnotalea sp. AF33-28]